MMVTAASLTALQVGFKKNFQDAYSATRPDADFTRVATVINSTSRSATYGWLGKFPKMREWVGDRVIKDMEAHGYSITNKDLDATVGIDRNDIEDDNLRIYALLFQEMGVSAAQQPDDLTFGLMAQGTTQTCYDGQYFLDTDHPSFNENGDAITVSNVDASGVAGDPWWYLLDETRPLKPMVHQQRKKPQFVARTDPQNSDHVFMKKEFLYGVDARCNVGFGLWQMAYASNTALDGDSLEARRSRRCAASATATAVRWASSRACCLSAPSCALPPTRPSRSCWANAVHRTPTYKAVEVLDTPWVA